MNCPICSQSFEISSKSLYCCTKMVNNQILYYHVDHFDCKKCSYYFSLGYKDVHFADITLNFEKELHLFSSLNCDFSIDFAQYIPNNRLLYKTTFIEKPDLLIDLQSLDLSNKLVYLYNYYQILQQSYLFI